MTKLTTAAGAPVVDNQKVITPALVRTGSDRQETLGGGPGRVVETVIAKEDVVPCSATDRVGSSATQEHVLVIPTVDQIASPESRIRHHQPVGDSQGADRRPELALITQHQIVAGPCLHPFVRGAPQAPGEAKRYL